LLSDDKVANKENSLVILRRNEEDDKTLKLNKNVF